MNNELEKMTSYEADKAAAGVESQPEVPFVPFIANPSIPAYFPLSPMPGFYGGAMVEDLAAGAFAAVAPTSAQADQGIDTPYHDTSEYTMIPPDETQTDKTGSEINTSGS